MTASSPTDAPPSNLYQSDFPPEEFAARRARIFEAIGPRACAVLQGGPPVRGFEAFRQTNQFYYGCGIEVPQAYLLLDASTRRTTLYLPHRPEGREAEGAALAAEDAEIIERLAGLDGVFGIEKLAEHLEAATVLYTPHRPAEGPRGSRDELTRADRAVADDPWDAQPTREQRFIELLKARRGELDIRDLSPAIDALRAVKSPREIALCRQAGHLSALAVIEAMRSTAPGVLEYQLAAVANYVYLLHGARGEGYRPIIAGGANAWHAHYFRNDCPLKDGDLVLMDAAPDFRYYTSDIGRMWPVNGSYTPGQRELYGFMVAYHKALLKRIRPGVTAEEIHAEAAAEMAEVVEATSFSNEARQAAAARTLEFKGHLSHSVGMAVHDVGGYGGRPLVPGVVFAVDPQMWVPEEKLYIRVEDTVVVTEEGIENLTVAAPLELEDVEVLLRDRSPLERPVPPAT